MAIKLWRVRYNGVPSCTNYSNLPSNRRISPNSECYSEVSNEDSQLQSTSLEEIISIWPDQGPLLYDPCSLVSVSEFSHVAYHAVPSVGAVVEVLRPVTRIHYPSLRQKSVDTWTWYLWICITERAFHFDHLVNMYRVGIFPPS